MAKKKKNSFWKDFKAFISKGNVVDMAVGVVIGGSFGKIVTGFVNFIINPVVGILTGKPDLASWKTVLREAVPEVVNEAGEVTQAAVAESAILWGSWIQTVIDFLITAFFIFVFLRLLMRVRNAIEIKKIEEEEAKKKAAEEKAAADAAAAAEAAAAALAKKEELEQSILRQEKFLAEIAETLKKR